MSERCGAILIETGHSCEVEAVPGNRFCHFHMEQYGEPLILVDGEPVIRLRGTAQILAYLELAASRVNLSTLTPRDAESIAKLCLVAVRLGERLAEERRLGEAAVRLHAPRATYRLYGDPA